MKVELEIQRLKLLPPNEPIFILRAQDVLAADVVREWARRAEALDVISTKVREARGIAKEMEQWPTRKTPD